MRNDSSRYARLQRTRNTSELQKPRFLVDIITAIVTAFVELTRLYCNMRGTLLNV